MDDACRLFVCRRGKEGKAMQPSCTEPNSLDTKGEKERTKGGRIKRRKEGGNGGFLQKNRILQIFVGII